MWALPHLLPTAERERERESHKSLPDSFHLRFLCLTSGSLASGPDFEKKKKEAEPFSVLSLLHSCVFRPRHRPWMIGG